MIDLESLESDLQSSRLAPNAQSLLECTAKAISSIKHGDLDRWQAALSSLPAVSELPVSLDQAIVTVGSKHSLNPDQQQSLREALLEFIPWRKGPFSVCGINIDTEWRSDLKWDRLASHLQPLAGRRVLDVGCGSGYHAWRIKAMGADYVVGIDPTLLFVMQFNVLQHFIQEKGISVLPLKLEDLPSGLQSFDTVFSMGVLYHRRDPLEHLSVLKEAMAKNGELVLETLVIPEGGPAYLAPSERYARMRNVWQIPTVSTLTKWLKNVGFRDCRAISESDTRTNEQRSTKWMPFESLQESLDPNELSLTIEGYPAPRRAIVLAGNGP